MSDDKYWYGLFEISIRHSKIKHLNSIETINVNNLKVIKIRFEQFTQKLLPIFK